MKNIFKDNTKNYTYGGLYGSSGSYIIEKISHNFDNTIILLNNNSEIINFGNELKLFSGASKEISLFLEIESFPYESLIYDVNVLSERLKTYKNIINGDNNIIVTSYSAISKYLVPKNILSKYFFQINKDFKYNELIALLRDLKYDRTEKVLNKGEYAIKGSIIDVYSTVEDNPIRMNFDSDKLETIKIFNIDSQISKDSVSDFTLGSANEIIITDNVIKTYKAKCRDVFDDEYIEDVEYEKIINSLPHPSAINIIPMLYDNLTTIFNLISNENNNIVLSLKDPFEEIKMIRERYKNYYNKYKEEKYILDYRSLIINEDDYISSINKMMKCMLSLYKVKTDVESMNSPIRKLPSLLIKNTFKDPYKSLRDYIQGNQNTIVFCIERNSLKIEIQKLLDSMDLEYNFFKNFNDIDNSKNIYIIQKILMMGLLIMKKILALFQQKIYLDQDLSILPKSQKIGL